MSDTEKDTKQHEEKELEEQKEQQEEQEHQEEEQEEEQEEQEEAAPATEEVVTGGRQRRSTQKFGFVETKDEDEEEFKPPTGSGVKVRDMEVVAERISHMGKKDAETIKSLYNIMYGRRFQQKNIRLIKDHILDFTGIPDADDKTRQQLVGKIGRWMRSYVQDVMDVLGVDRSKKSFDEEGKLFDKEALINRLIDWLCEPQESGKAAKKTVTKKKAAAKPAATKKTAKAAKETAGTKRKSAATTKKPAKKAKTTAKKSAAPVEEEDEEDATESEVEKEEDEAMDSDSDFDEEEGPKAKKSKTKTPTKRAPRQTKKKKTASAASDSEDDAKADEKEETHDKKEETKAAIVEEKPAETSSLGADVQKKVQDIIAKGDASQLTVKKIVRQLSEDMGQDFTPQKAAIKDFVTNLQM